MLPCSTRSVRDARTRLRTDLASSDLPREVVEDALLVVSELVSNSLRHARGLPGDRIGLAWWCRDGSVTVRVTDGGGSAFPVARPPPTSALGGRGLAMVEAVSADWGVERSRAETTVWAVVGDPPGGVGRR
jgi:anti-sigma regulatory factor (Ser/Thr protein kinase)